MSVLKAVYDTVPKMEQKIKDRMNRQSVLDNVPAGKVFGLL